MRHLTILLCLLTCVSLTNCASYDFSRRTVQQGNILRADKIQRLHLGMSKQDVAILMGTSLLSPNFNNDRWDYAYTIRRGSDALKVKNVTLTFRNGHLAQIEHHP